MVFSIFFVKKNVTEESESRKLIFEILKLSKIVERLRGCSYGGELARISGLAGLGEMIFIPRANGIFYFSSIKKFVMSLEKDYLIKYFLQ